MRLFLQRISECGKMQEWALLQDFYYIALALEIAQ